MIQTRDGGFIVCGLTFSNDGDFKTKDTINGDAYLAKYNRFGKLEWTKTYGGSGNDVFNDIAILGLDSIFFGYYPAQKASRLDPIEALRMSNER